MDDLGGTIKIGEEKTKFPTEIITEAFLKKNKQAQSQITESLASSGLVDEMTKSPEKMLFGVSVYCAENTFRPLSAVIQRFVGSAVKDELRGMARNQSLWVSPKIESLLSLAMLKC